MAATEPLTLTEFLLARIAEDETVARDVVAGGGYNGRDSTGPRLDEEYGGLHIGAARVVVECDAKRRIVEAHTPLDNEECDPSCGDIMSPCRTLAALAAIYADHPDYREEWRA